MLETTVHTNNQAIFLRVKNCENGRTKFLCRKCSRNEGFNAENVLYPASRVMCCARNFSHKP